MCFWNEPDVFQIGKFRGMDTPEEFLNHRDRLKDDFRQQIAESAPSHLILSAELLCDFRAEEIDRLFDFLGNDFDEIRVIAFLRDPLSWINSAAQQDLKWAGHTLDNVISDPRKPDHETWLRPFINRVGEKNVILKPFRKGDRDFNLIGEFCAGIGIRNYSEIVIPSDRKNESVSVTSAFLLSKINEIQPPFVDFKHNPFRAFRLVADLQFPGQKFSLPQSTLEALGEKISIEAKWINEMLQNPTFARHRIHPSPSQEWDALYRSNIEARAEALSIMCSQAQNDRALKSFLRAQKRFATEPDLACKLLTNAWISATDPWTLSQIANWAAEIDFRERRKVFAKQRFMAAIEKHGVDRGVFSLSNPFHRKSLVQELSD